MPSFGLRNVSRRAVLMTAAGAVLALFGVGGSASAGAGGAGNESRPRSGRHYEGVGLRLAPAPEDAVPAVSAAEAISAFRDNWSWTGGTFTHAELFVGSDGCFGDAAEPAGSSTFTNRLVWVLSRRGIREAIHGPATLSPNDRARTRRETTVTGVGVVDATTAEVLMIFSTADRRTR